MVPPPPGPPPGWDPAEVITVTAEVFYIGTPIPVTPRGGGGGDEQALPAPWRNMGGGTVVMKLQPLQVNIKHFRIAVEELRNHLGGEIRYHCARAGDYFEASVKQQRVANRDKKFVPITVVMMIHNVPPRTEDAVYRQFRAGFLLRGVSYAIMEDVMFKRALRALSTMFAFEVIEVA